MVIEDFYNVYSDNINDRFIEIYFSNEIGFGKDSVEVYVDNVLYRQTRGNFDKEEEQKKILKNLSLCPAGAKILRKSELPEYNGKLLSGALTDSCYTVHSFAGYPGGLHGYCCSVFWVPTKEELKQLIVNF